jgi:hypothetical protein
MDKYATIVLLLCIIIGMQATILVVAYKNFNRLYGATIRLLDILSQKNVLRKGLK